MNKHDIFDIHLHDDEELAALHGAPLSWRESLRAWPLSLVERVAFKDGTSRIYKACRSFSVELDFYRTAESPNIPKLFYSHSEGDQYWLLLEDVGGQHPADLGREDAFKLALRARDVIRGIQYAGPWRHDISETGYRGFADSTVALLRKLRREEKLSLTDGELIDHIAEVLSHPEARRVARGGRSMLHGDMKLDNMLIRPDGGLTIIDWQNVMFGPEAIDLYSLMATQGMDPIPEAGIGPEILRLALEMRWFADCLDYWMPTANFLDPWIATIGKHMRHIAEHKGYAGMEVYYFH
jgi:hypothetical protein